MSLLGGKSTSFTKNSAEFSRPIRNHSIQDDEVMVSFDVVSLFTKVPVDLAVSIAHDCLKKDASLEDHTLLSPDEIASLLSFCLNATYFTFRGGFYKQIFCAAMGSPVSVVPANLVMEVVEQKALNSFKGKVSISKRYMNDTFTIVQ